MAPSGRGTIIPRAVRLLKERRMRVLAERCARHQLNAARS